MRRTVIDNASYSHKGKICANKVLLGYEEMYLVNMSLLFFFFFYGTEDFYFVVLLSRWQDTTPRHWRQQSCHFYNIHDAIMFLQSRQYMRLLENDPPPPTYTHT